MQKDQNDILTAALEYAGKFGFSVIPIRPDKKKPHVKWEPYQKQKATLDQIRSWWQRWPDAKIGVVTGSVSGMVAVDIDREEGLQRVSEYFTSSVIPTCRTPRGGYHLYFRCPDKPPKSNNRAIPGTEFKAEGTNIIIEGEGYEWLPGLSLADIPLPDLPERYILFINSLAVGGYKGGNRHDTKNEHDGAREGTTEHEMFEYGTRDNDLFHTANCLVKGGMPENEIRQVLERLILSWGENPDKKWIDDKITSALKRADRRQRNFAEDLRKWVLSTDGHFSSTEYHAEARLSTREDKHAVTECLRRMVVEGLIEKYGDKRGVYRKVDKEYETIDFLKAPDEIFKIQWPFQIEKYVELCPKNVCVVAGTKDAGKTAFLLNVVRLNMALHRIFYFSSEMGDRELRKRLQRFNLPLTDWSFTPVDRSSNFADVIQPNDLNVIDFLEIYEDFYKIGLWIKEIYNKLQKGIAIIAIQKNPNLDWGLGGHRSMEKARLYLLLENGTIKIRSGKNWASEVRPDGLCLDFKLIGGCDFKVQRDWYRLN